MKVIYTVGLIVVSFFRSGRKFEANRGEESSGGIEIRLETIRLEMRHF